MQDGWKGWAALAALVLVWDAWAVTSGHQTMSDAYTVALARRRAPVVLGTTYIVAHLASRPRALTRVDPLRVAARTITTRASRRRPESASAPVHASGGSPTRPYSH